MAGYQNLFTQVQVRGPAELGIELPLGNLPRAGVPWFSRLMGILGNAQIGPIYLGWTGMASLVFGFLAYAAVRWVQQGDRGQCGEGD